MIQKCILRGGVVRIRPDRDTLWTLIFQAKYCRRWEDKARFQVYALKAYDRPDWSLPKIHRWAQLRRMAH